MNKLGILQMQLSCISNPHSTAMFCNAKNKPSLTFGHTWDSNPGLLGESSFFDPSNHPNPLLTCPFLALYTTTLEGQLAMML